MAAAVQAVSEGRWPDETEVRARLRDGRGNQQAQSLKRMSFLTPLRTAWSAAVTGRRSRQYSS